MSYVLVIAFIAVNIADAYFTRVNLAMGATELNPLARPFGADMLIRGLMAAAIGTVICLAGKTWWLVPLNVVVLSVVLWNLWEAG